MRKCFVLLAVFVLGFVLNAFGNQNAIPLSFKDSKAINGTEVPSYWGKNMTFVPLEERLSSAMGYPIPTDEVERISNLLNVIAKDSSLRLTGSDLTLKVVEVYDNNFSTFKAKISLNIISHDGRTVSLTDIFVRDIGRGNWYSLQ